MLTERNTILFKSLIWTTLVIVNKNITPLLADITTNCFASGVAVKLGNACLNTLGKMGLDGVAQLAILKFRVKHNHAQKRIESLINKAAQELGITKGDIEDLSVPDYGLSDGKYRQQLGNFTAELEIVKTSKTVPEDAVFPMIILFSKYIISS